MAMKKSIIILFCAFMYGNVLSQKLSEEATISVITCGPYQEAVYFAFGHSAIRVMDSVAGFDYVFNYGVFDFNQPNFYLNFARGYNYYLLGAYDYQHFKSSYIEDNRFIHEQILNLTPAQKEKVYNYLIWNAQPENRSYRYDYFYDNCATRVRDVFAKVLDKDVKFDGSYITTEYSIRQLTDVYLKQQPWGDLGIDIGLGLPMDKIASPYEYMFLPAYIESGFDHATISNDSATVPLVKEKKIVYESRPEEVSGLPHPLYVFGAVALIALILCARDFRNQNISGWFDVLLFGSAGLLGILLLMLWFLTDHKAAANNLNLLWALPTHFIVVFAFIRNPPWLKHYFMIASIFYLALLAGWFFLPQQLNTALIPIVVALMLRSYIQYVLRKRGVYKRASIARALA